MSERKKLEKKKPVRISLRKSVNLMCKTCIYDKTGSGNWRQQTEGCTAATCPLYNVRPVSSTSVDNG